MNTKMDKRGVAREIEVARAGWGSGPWDNEPDRVEWRCPDTSFACLMVRNGMGAWCGYVGVPSTHPFHGDGYDEHYDLCVHGGLTYAEACSGRVCHVPEPGESDDVWWFGFDCGHWRDTIPAMPTPLSHTEYRDVAFVKAEVKRLAHQLDKLDKR